MTTQYYTDDNDSSHVSVCRGHAPSGLKTLPTQLNRTCSNRTTQCNKYSHNNMHEPTIRIVALLWEDTILYVGILNILYPAYTNTPSLPLPLLAFPYFRVGDGCDLKRDRRGLFTTISHILHPHADDVCVSCLINLSLHCITLQHCLQQL